MPEQSPQAEAKLLAALQKWAEGKATLKEVRGYTDEQLYAIAKTAYLFYYQGKIDQARTLFQGLYAINPADGYFARALGVIEFASGNTQGALTAYDVAIKLNPEDAAALIGRAEVKIASGQKAQAVEDLRRAQTLTDDDNPLKAKASAILGTLKSR